MISEGTALLSGEAEFVNSALIIEELAGGLQVKSIALAEGTWAGVFYPYGDIKLSIKELEGKPNKVEHMLSEEFGSKTVGKVIKTHADDEVRAMFALSTATDSKVVSLIKSGKLSAVSVRVKFNYNPNEKRPDGSIIAHNLTYDELSYVVKPACSKCHIKGIKSLSCTHKVDNESINMVYSTLRNETVMAEDNSEVGNVGVESLTEDKVKAIVKASLSGQCESILTEHLPSVLPKLIAEKKLEGVFNPEPGVPELGVIEGLIRSANEETKKGIEAAMDQVMSEKFEGLIKEKFPEIEKLGEAVDTINKLSDEVKEIKLSQQQFTDEVKQSVEQFNTWIKSFAEKAAAITEVGEKIQSMSEKIEKLSETPVKKSIQEIIDSEEIAGQSGGDLLLRLHKQYKEERS